MSSYLLKIILTSHAGPEAVHHALALGADGFLLKNSTAHQIATAVRAVAAG